MNRPIYSTPQGAGRDSCRVFHPRKLAEFCTYAFLVALVMALAVLPRAAFGQNVTASISSSPSAMTYPTVGPITLTWSSTNATSVSVTAHDGSGFSSTALSGTATIYANPSAADISLIYTITAQGPGGPVTSRAITTENEGTQPPATLTVSGNSTSVGGTPIQLTPGGTGGWGGWAWDVGGTGHGTIAASNGNWYFTADQPGNCTISVYDRGDNYYLASSSAYQTVHVIGLSQPAPTLSCSGVYIGNNAPLNPSGALSSAGYVYNIVSGSGFGRITGDTITGLATGNVVVQVASAGDRVYEQSPWSGNYTIAVTPWAPSGPGKGYPTITWPTPAPIAYGTPLTSAQLNASSDIPGSFTYSPAVGTVLPRGYQPLTATFTPADPSVATGAEATVFIGVFGQSTRIASTSTFMCTGGNQTLTIPNGVEIARIHAWGAGGGGSAYQYAGAYVGGAGGYVLGDQYVSAGDVLTIQTASPGALGAVAISTNNFIANNGWPNGGSGGWQFSASFDQTSGGGGSSNIFFTRTGTEYARVVAGGGGGPSNWATGGGNAGGTAASPTLYYGSGSMGLGGSQTAGGLGGSAFGATGVAGTYMAGANASPAWTAGGGAGGGGGYYGGGSGIYTQGYDNTQHRRTEQGAGGGGSSYVPGSMMLATLGSPPYQGRPAGTTDPFYQAHVAEGGGSQISNGNLDYRNSTMYTSKSGGTGLVVVELISSRQSQTITFPAIPTHTFGDAPFALSASATSGYPCFFSVVSGPAVINGSTLSITGAGTVTVAANQPGDWEDWNAASPVTQSFAVLPSVQPKPTLNPNTLVIATYDSLPLFPRGGSGTGAWSFTFDSGSSLASVSGAALVPNGSASGTVQLRVQRLGDSQYSASPWSDPVTITILKALPGASNFQHQGQDLDSIFELRNCIAEGSVATPFADLEQDLRYRYAPASAGAVSSQATTYSLPDGRDLNQIFAAKGSVPPLLPALLSGPTNQSVMPGTTVTFYAQFSNALSYQWYKAGVAINGATAETLILRNVNAGDGAAYYCAAGNTNGSTLSNSATLSVKQQVTQTFTSSGTFTPPAGVTSIELLLVGGGGGGNSGAYYYDSSNPPVQWNGGGGGGGGIYYNASVPVSGPVTVTIGAGGSGGLVSYFADKSDHGQDGGASSFGAYTAPGGKGGARWAAAVGSLGGASGGNTGNGGNGAYLSADQSSFIGGAAGADGAYYLGQWYGGGGGGGMYGRDTGGQDIILVGGRGGGGRGASQSQYGGVNGTPNSGGGGGGGSYYFGSNNNQGGNGGAGIAIVRYWN